MDMEVARCDDRNQHHSGDDQIGHMDWQASEFELSSQWPELTDILPRKVQILAFPLYIYSNIYNIYILTQNHI